MAKREANRPCLICGGEASALLHELDYSRFGYPGVFVLRRCSGCGLIFNSPRLEGPELTELYQRNYYFFRRPHPDLFARAAAAYRRAVAPADPGPAKRRTLEVGCARGHLLAALARLGWEVEGVELSAEAASFARETFGLKVFTGSLQDYLAAGGGGDGFPLVLALDLIEHVPDPAGFLAAAAQAVEPGGALVLDTPNAASAVGERLGASWKGFNPYHIFAFSAATLSVLVERAGFRVERAFSYNNSAPTPEAETAGEKGRRPGLMRRAAARLARELSRALAPSAAEQLRRLLAKTVGDLETGAGYFETADASAEFAAGARGENLVVIARKARG